jgi:hypothetical protein
MLVEPLIVKPSNRLIRFNDRRINVQHLLRFRFLAGPLAARGNLVFAGLPLVVAFADLLLDFFGDLVNGRVKIAFDVLGKKIGPVHTQANGAGPLFSGGAGMIVFERHPRINGALVKMVEFLQLFDDMILDGLGQSDVVRRKYQFHASNMQSAGEKIQFFLGFLVVGYFCAKRLDK